MGLNVVLSNPRQYGSKTYYINLGLATVGAIARQAGHSVSVVDFDELKCKEIEFSESVYRGEGRFSTVDVVLLSGMITNLKNVLAAVKALRSAKEDLIIVMGGGASSVATPQILSHLAKNGIDFFVTGEGDDVTLPLLAYIEENIRSSRNPKDWPECKVPNVRWSQDGKVGGVCQTKSPDVTNVPMPAYDLFCLDTYMDYLKRANRSWELYSSRGCPMGCAFCYKISGSNVRYRDVKLVMEEMDWIYKTTGMSKFSFVDDTFGLKRDWLWPFCEENQKRGYKFRMQAFVNSMRSLDHVTRMQEAGLVGISMGIESGSPRILKEMRKNNDLKAAQAVIALANKSNIRVSATFILGMPGENWESVEETKNFLCTNRLDDFQIFFLNPYPGTALYGDLLAQNKLENEFDHVLNFRLQNEIYVNLTKFPDEELFQMREYILNSVAEHWKVDKMNPATWERYL